MILPDIILIDNNIKKRFQEEKTKIDEYISKKNELEFLINKNISVNISNNTRYSILSEIKKLDNKIRDITDNITENFYLFDTIPLTNNYKNILQSPLKKKSNDIEYKKIQLIISYFDILKKYHISTDFIKNYEFIIPTLPNNEIDINKENLHIENSYKDIDRINITSKYTYDRRVHFNDCILQYQGKQNCTIYPIVYHDLIQQFKRLNLLIGDINNPKEIRYSNITKDHIFILLKETNHSKHYEDINLIHYKLTNIKPPDISHLKDKLMKMFDKLIKDYNIIKIKYNIKRKSSLNVHYLLYKFLCTLKEPCKKSDFNMLKTLDRQIFHDDICKELFKEYGWTFTPFF